jgi:excisionase family DNA binding protein
MTRRARIQAELDIAPVADPLTALIRAAVADALAPLLVELREQRPAPQPEGPARLTVGEAAEQLRCSTRQVRRMLARGQLRATKLGRRVLISRAELERALREASRC